MVKKYGIELILDLNDCDPNTFTRLNLTKFFNKIAKITDMKLALSPYFWDDDNGENLNEDHLIGTSAFHFIQTSNITIHTLSILKAVMINLFTCKDFNVEETCRYIEGFFKGKIVKKTVIDRVY